MQNTVRGETLIQWKLMIIPSKAAENFRFAKIRRAKRWKRTCALRHKMAWCSSTRQKNETSRTGVPQVKNILLERKT